MAKKIYIDGNSLTINEVNSVARLGAKVALTESARKKVRESRRVLQELINRDEVIYGVTTGIGDLANTSISKEMGKELQKRIIYSHSAGTGDPQPKDVVRAAIVCRVNSISKGYSAVRLELINTLVRMLNRGVIPLVREKGSVGASGDLSPLAQIAEVILGGGEAYYNGELIPGALALKKAGIRPLTPTFKEGLALINGSQMMNGELALKCLDAENILKNAIIASAMTIDALRGKRNAFDARIHSLRPFPGQAAAAENIRRLTAESTITEIPSGTVQDSYSLRCTPQVLGPSLDTLAYVKRQVEIEMNSATDNPLFFTSGDAHLEGGNFHGQPIAMAADFLAIALAEAASLSERHTNRLLNNTLSGLPDFLAESSGLNSGLMVAQYTAAALVSENKILSHPGVVDSISVSGNQEDHVSMGPVSVRKLGEVCRNVTAVTAIEMMTAAQALDFRKPKKPGRGTGAAYRKIRKEIDHLADDRPLHPDIEKITELVREGIIVKAVERVTGPINLGSYPY